MPINHFNKPSTSGKAVRYRSLLWMCRPSTGRPPRVRVPNGGHPGRGPPPYCLRHAAPCGNPAGQALRDKIAIRLIRLFRHFIPARRTSSIPCVPSDTTPDGATRCRGETQGCNGLFGPSNAQRRSWGRHSRSPDKYNSLPMQALIPIESL